ncbi:MAG TPA: sulfotransferase [Xanthomonadaceae bacterium]|nr:sulfotransferase [Xanthomonadaceae bacterium]
MTRKGQASGGNRLRGLDGRVRGILVEVSRAYAVGRHDQARAHWLAADRLASGHPELARWSALLDLADGAPAEAESSLRRALDARPEDGELMRLLGEALAAQSRYDEAAAMLALAFRCIDDAAGFFELGKACDRLGFHQQALEAVEACLALSPGSSKAGLLRARCLVLLGRSSEAATECRRLIGAPSKASARAWFMLLDMKTESLHAEEIRQLESEQRRATDPDDRVLLAFALGQAYELYGEYELALRTLQDANRLAAVTRPWDRVAFRNQCRAVADAFQEVACSSDAMQGAEVVFLVGMPRSGSTLFEQVLSAHPGVEAASELPNLARVLQIESRKRGQALPNWAPRASAADWARLGRDYLQATARWRQVRAVSTDKMPSNWLLAGAAMAMLPNARFIECERDPIDTCWSCYRQLFAPGQADYTYDFADLAAHWKDLRRLGQLWADRNPGRYRRFQYETLVERPQDTVRELLEFCGLPFDPGCLKPHLASRAVRTASAAQVRQPLARRTPPRVAYGALLDPLRERLESSD